MESNASSSRSKSSDNTSSAFTSAESALSNLNISRNKHWRFISSYHGQWLQLPLELLESLAYSNHFSSRPHSVDDAAFFDIVRIRRLVDEATSLSVRATNGTISSALGTSLSAGQNLHRNGAKLSGERRFRMRELAVRKLSEAYHLDEIAASVATMQSASSLDDVAKAVLQRAPNDVHAKYVNFFHEKIPSRALAESTSLLPLNEILRESSIDSATLRTRAITKVLKEDYDGAIKDLTEALNSVPRDNIQHLDRGSSNNARNETVVSCHVTRDAKHYKQRLNDDQKPTGMEAQLHFQRATVQLGLACQSVEAVLKVKWPSQQESTENTSIDSDTRFHQSLPAYQKVKLNTKRALRDLTFFLSKLEYSPGLAIKVGGTVPAAPSDKGLLQGSNNSSDHIQLEPSIKTSVTAGKTTNLDSENPSARIYQISNLFSTTPPTDLPPFPSTLSNPHEPESSKNSQTNQVMSTIRSERVTYHPLLSEALHGLLLCHSLLQTDTSTIHKYAYMVARLVSLSDGLPIFLSSRSASRADWTDILFETKDWLKLDHSWDHLCQSSRTSRERRSKLPSQPANHQNETTGNSTKSPDNDGDSNDETPSSKLPSAKQQNHHPDLKAYSLGTDRAAIIKRWIMEAPHLPDASVKPRKGKKKGGGGAP